MYRPFFMLLRDPFYDKAAKRINITYASIVLSAKEKAKWEIAHYDVRRHFEATLYHFGRMLRENHFNNSKAMSFERDALISSLYSVRDHLLQELNVFFCLGISQKEVSFNEKFKDRLKRKLESLGLGQGSSILDMLKELNDEKWFGYLKDRRHTIQHRVSKPEGLVTSLRWDNEPPQPVLNRELLGIYGEDFREAVLKSWPKAPIYYEWLAVSLVTIRLFKKYIEKIWCEMSSYVNTPKVN